MTIVDGVRYPKKYPPIRGRELELGVWLLAAGPRFFITGPLTDDGTPGHVEFLWPDLVWRPSWREIRGHTSRPWLWANVLLARGCHDALFVTAEEAELTLAAWALTAGEKNDAD